MSVRKETSSYRSILKGASLFGGVQVFQMLISIVRSKFVAAILGPAGWGISGLFTTSSNTLVKLGSLGLNLAFVKETAANLEDQEKLGVMMKVARRLLLVTSLFGALICILFSRWLSLSTFDSTDYIPDFILLGVFIFFSIYGNGQLSILQGLREGKKLVRASIVGSITGLVVGVPMYYVWGTAGIVPAMCVLSFVTWVFYTRSVNRSIPERSGNFSWREHSPMVKKLVAIGLVLMSSDMIGSFTTYLAQIFIRHFSDLSVVGLYTSATMMTTQYSSVVFTAMAMDYLPRLSQVAGDNSEVNKVVNRQSEIVALIIAPVVCLFILLAPIVIRVLLSDEFMPALELLRWMALGVTFRALMYPLGYITFAKDNRKLFFWMEGVFCNFLTLGLSCVFFYFFGLVGLGYAMVVDGALCLGLYYVVNRKLYGYRFDDKALRMMVMAIIFTAGALLITLDVDGPVMYGAVTAVTLVSIGVSFYKLKKLIKPEQKEPESTESQPKSEHSEGEV